MSFYHLVIDEFYDGCRLGVCADLESGLEEEQSLSEREAGLEERVVAAKNLGGKGGEEDEMRGMRGAWDDVRETNEERGQERERKYDE